MLLSPYTRTWCHFITTRVQSLKSISYHSDNSQPASRKKRVLSSDPKCPFRTLINYLSCFPPKHTSVATCCSIMMILPRMNVGEEPRFSRAMLMLSSDRYRLGQLTWKARNTVPPDPLGEPTIVGKKRAMSCPQRGESTCAAHTSPTRTVMFCAFCLFDPEGSQIERDAEGSGNSPKWFRLGPSCS